MAESGFQTSEIDESFDVVDIFGISKYTPDHQWSLPVSLANASEADFVFYSLSSHSISCIDSKKKPNDTF